MEGAGEGEGAEAKEAEEGAAPAAEGDATPLAEGEVAEQKAEGEGAEPAEGEEGEKPATTEGEADIPQVRHGIGLLVLITTAYQHIVLPWYYKNHCIQILSTKSANRKCA